MNEDAAADEAAVAKHFAAYGAYIQGQVLDVVRRAEVEEGEEPPNLRRLAALLIVVAERVVGEA